MKSLGIAGCNLESLLLACEGIRAGFVVNVPPECPCGIRYEDIEQLIKESDFFTFFGKKPPERIITGAGRKAVPPIYSMNAHRRWKEIARNLGISVWGPPLPHPPFDGKRVFSIMVIRSRKGEIKHYPISRLYNIDRHTYWGFFKPEKNLLWDIWDITSRMAQEIGYVGLSSFTFVFDGNLHIQSIELNTIRNSEWVDGSTLTSPFQQIYRALLPVYLGETDIITNAASIRTENTGPEIAKRILNLEGTEIRRFRDDTIITVRGRDAQEIKRRMEKILKIVMK